MIGRIGQAVEKVNQPRSRGGADGLKVAIELDAAHDELVCPYLAVVASHDTEPTRTAASGAVKPSRPKHPTSRSRRNSGSFSAVHSYGALRFVPVDARVSWLILTKIDL
jgi:hypothetical protein